MAAWTVDAERGQPRSVRLADVVVADRGEQVALSRPASRAAPPRRRRRRPAPPTLGRVGDLAGARGTRSTTPERDPFECAPRPPRASAQSVGVDAARPYARRMQSRRRLTAFSHGAGCACKLGPGQLHRCMGMLALPGCPAEMLVCAETGDDAAVWRLATDRALIATVDFFTPIVDDPYDWGRIAATNALSRRVRDGRAAGHGAEHRRVAGRRPPARACCRSVLQGGQDVATERRGRGRRRRPHDHRPPSRSTAWWRSGSSTRTG